MTKKFEEYYNSELKDYVEKIVLLTTSYVTEETLKKMFAICYINSRKHYEKELEEQYNKMKQKDEK